jgi:carbonic anhydrase
MRILTTIFVCAGLLAQNAMARDPERAGSAPEQGAKFDSSRETGRAKAPLTESEIAAMVKAKLAEIRKARAIRAAESRRAQDAPDYSPGIRAPGEDGEHWSYEGETGPARWGKLNPLWAKCDSGARQSPIDIRDGIKVDLEPVVVDYQPTSFNVLDNGHTVQVNLGTGNRITLTGRTYELQQFHFHRPAEEKVDGRGFGMVAHLVHKDSDGRLAVIAVLMEAGKPHSLVQTIWNNLPLEKNEPLVPTSTIDVSQLLPQRREYYTYMGSLTTPPCSEGVLWIVMKEPIQVSEQQMAIFARLYPMNARPVQASSGRLIKESN